MKVGMQGKRPSAGREVKIWSVGCALQFYLVQYAGILSRRRENPADPVNGAQVGMLERIGSANRRVTWTVWLPRTKQATGLDLSDGFGICQVGIEMHGRSGTDRGHS